MCEIALINAAKIHTIDLLVVHRIGYLVLAYYWCNSKNIVMDREEIFMDSDVTSTPRWSTSSFGGPASTSPMELSALGRHMDRCNGARGPMFLLRGVAQVINRWVAPRLVTTVLVTTLLIGVGSMLL